MERSDIVRAQLEAVSEFQYQEFLALCRAYPDWLRTNKEHERRVDAFLAERGLPPLPERYPELSDPSAADSL